MGFLFLFNRSSECIFCSVILRNNDVAVIFQAQAGNTYHLIRPHLFLQPSDDENKNFLKRLGC